MLNPHLNQPVLESGCKIEDAARVVILVHGRGQDPRFMQETIADPLALNDVAYFIPCAANASWYPMGFMAPFEENEPWLSHTMECIHKLVESLCPEICARDQLRLVGFSQGACVVAEYICRYPQRFGGVAVLTGGLIGPEGTKWAGASLEGTPVLLATSDIDPWVALSRVEESRDVLISRGANVDFRVYKGMDHTINAEEIDALRLLIKG